jgi:hypothetical protein
MTNYFEINDDHLCEAVGCFERSTTDIKLKVGQRQTIILHVCTNCINKFAKALQTGQIGVASHDSVCSGCSPHHPRGDDLNR